MESSWIGSWRTVGLLVRYWLKGRFTRASLVLLIGGEVISVIFVLFAGGVFLSFSSRFGQGAGLSVAALNLILALYLVGVIQSGFNGSGLPVSAADVDYVFTSPISSRTVFAAKVLMNSLTTVVLSFPPLFALYLRLASSFGTPLAGAVLAGLATLVFFVMGLIISADLTLSLGSSIGPRLRLARNVFVALVVAISLIPFTLLIPGVPPILGSVTRVLPNGLTASISVGLVSGTADGFALLVDCLLLAGWLVAFLVLGVRLSRRHFYEVLQIGELGSEREPSQGDVSLRLETRGKSIWSVVRLKETVLMSRTKERRALLINALFLSGFLVIYSLSGAFQSSPTSFLFILFIIGSFGSSNATMWLEKERLWIIKTSAIDVRRYVKEVFRARAAPLVLYLTPVTIAVGVPLLLSESNLLGPFLSVTLALPAALELAAITMGGSMYFASKYGQSTSDDILSSEAQNLTDVRRFIYQTAINLLFVSPLMTLVLGAGYLPAIFGRGFAFPFAVVLLAASLVYTLLILNALLDRAGDSIQRREDL